jgi:hypothetical protein
VVKNKGLIFIETKEEVDLYLDYLDDNTVVEVVSLLPEERATLDSADVKYKNCSEYFNLNSHIETSKKCRKIIEHIRPLILALYQDRVVDAFERTALYYFKFYLTYLISQISIIHNAFVSIRPDYLLVLPFGSISGLDAQLKNDGGLLNAIVEQYALDNDIEIVYLASNSKGHKKNKTKKNSLVEMLAFEVSLFMYRMIPKSVNVIGAPYDTIGMPNLLTKVSKKYTKTLIVYYSTTSKTIKNRVFDQLKGESLTFYSLKAYIPKMKRNVLYNNINKCVELVCIKVNKKNNDFVFKNVSLNKLLTPYIENGLKIKMNDLCHNIWALNRIFRVKKPSVIFAQHSLGLSSAFGEMCLSEKIPSMLIPHGSFVPQTGEVPEYEWREHARTLFETSYKFVAIQTPIAKKYYDNQCIKLGAVKMSKPINTGPLLFANQDRMHYSDNLIFKGPHNKKILLHAGTPKSFTGFRPFIYETIDEYVNNINDIIKAVDLLPDVYLIIRFREVYGLSLNAFENLLCDSINYEICSDGVFLDYLLSSDLTISYSSTAIEESLKNNIPVLQYDSDDKYMHIESMIIDENKGFKPYPIYYCTDKSSLYFSLKLIFENLDLINKCNKWTDYQSNIDRDLGWVDEVMGEDASRNS